VYTNLYSTDVAKYSKKNKKQKIKMVKLIVAVLH